MEKARYTVKALADECGVSVQSIYSLKKNNDELRELCEIHSSKVKGANSYGPAVLEWLLAYYQKAPEPPVEAVEPTQEELEENIRAEFQAALEAKETEIEALNQRVVEQAETIKLLSSLLEDMSKQKEHILLLLGEEQQRVKLLEAPKEGIIKRISKIFSKNKQNEK